MHQKAWQIDEQTDQRMNWQVTIKQYIDDLFISSVDTRHWKMDGGATEADRWREIAAQKEKEWKEATEQRYVW